jgi:hypothetical protein
MKHNNPSTDLTEEMVRDFIHHQSKKFYSGAKKEINTKPDGQITAWAKEQFAQYEMRIGYGFNRDAYMNGVRTPLLDDIWWIKSAWEWLL